MPDLLGGQRRGVEADAIAAVDLHVAEGGRDPVGFEVGGHVGGGGHGPDHAVDAGDVKCLAGAIVAGPDAHGIPYGNMLLIIQPATPAQPQNSISTATPRPMNNPLCLPVTIGFGAISGVAGRCGVGTSSTSNSIRGGAATTGASHGPGQLHCGRERDHSGNGDRRR